jgi:hypothetical protein
MKKVIGGREMLSKGELLVRAHKRAKALKLAVARLNSDLAMLGIVGVGDEEVCGALKDLQRKLLTSWPE